MLDDADNILFRGRFTRGGSTSFDDRGLFLGSTRENLQLAVRSGGLELTGTVPGATINTATGTGLGSGYRVSSTGVMMFGATLFDGNVIVNTANDTLLYHGTPGNFQILVREGDPAVGTVGATYSSGFSSPSQQMTGLIGAGHAYFVSSLTGGDVVGTTNNSGLFTGTPGNLVLVAREGDVAPGTGGGTFGSVSGQSQMMNDAGQILFSNTLIGGTSPGSSLWSWDSVRGLQAVVLSGDSIEVQPTVFDTVSSQGGVQFHHGAARPLSFSDDGTATLRVSFTSGISAIMMTNVGSLFATPTTISTTLGGTQTLYCSAGTANANNTYLVLGSASGTTPGFFLGSLHCAPSTTGAASPLPLLVGQKFSRR